MTMIQAVTTGLIGEKLSRTITGTNEVIAGRSVLATGAGTPLCGTIPEAVARTIHTLELPAMVAASTAPLVIPLAIASRAVARIRSLWD